MCLVQACLEHAKCSVGSVLSYVFRTPPHPKSFVFCIYPTIKHTFPPPAKQKATNTIGVFIISTVPRSGNDHDSNCTRRRFQAQNSECAGLPMAVFSKVVPLECPVPASLRPWQVSGHFLQEGNTWLRTFLVHCLHAWASDPCPCTRATPSLHSWASSSAIARVCTRSHTTTFLETRLSLTTS